MPYVPLQDLLPVNPKLIPPSPQLFGHSLHYSICVSLEGHNVVLSVSMYVTLPASVVYISFVLVRLFIVDARLSSCNEISCTSCLITGSLALIHTGWQFISIYTCRSRSIWLYIYHVVSLFLNHFVSLLFSLFFLHPFTNHSFYHTFTFALPRPPVEHQ